jgi:hypothetical protein
LRVKLRRNKFRTFHLDRTCRTLGLTCWRREEFIEHSLLCKGVAPKNFSTAVSRLISVASIPISGSFAAAEINTSAGETSGLERRADARRSPRREFRFPAPKRKAKVKQRVSVSSGPQRKVTSCRTPISLLPLLRCRVFAAPSATRSGRERRSPEF